jgi:hypothetical protein
MFVDDDDDDDDDSSNYRAGTVLELTATCTGLVKLYFCFPRDGHWTLSRA